MLRVQDFSARDGQILVRDVSLALSAGEVVLLLGDNLSGAAELGRAIAGLIPTTGGAITLQTGAGARDITGYSARSRYRCGLIFVPAEKPVFNDLTVSENLRLIEAVLGSSKVQYRSALGATLMHFPLLQNKLKQQAGTLSGGEKRILALARAYLATCARSSAADGAASVLILEQPTYGLAPVAMTTVSSAVRKLVAPNVSVLLIEQNLPFGLALSDRFLEFREGRIEKEGSSKNAKQYDSCEAP